MIRFCFFLAASTLCRINFISMVRPTVHTNPTEKGRFWKTLLNGRTNIKTVFYGLLRTENVHIAIIISLAEFFSKTCKSEMNGTVWVFKSLRRDVDRKLLMRFQSETFASKFFRKANILHLKFMICDISNHSCINMLELLSKSWRRSCGLRYMYAKAKSKLCLERFIA